MSARNECPPWKGQASVVSVIKRGSGFDKQLMYPETDSLFRLLLFEELIIGILR